MNSFEGRSLTCIRGERGVFHDLDFRVAAGGALVLVGPNGAGKSSLLRLMAGLLPPTRGTLLWDDADIRDDAEAHRARLHHVGHLDAVKPVLTVAENVGFWAEISNGPEVDTQAAVAEALDALAIGHLADMPGRFLSAGQKRRTNLARLIAAPADLWLLDEPTTALDAETTGRLKDLISRHRAAGGMVVVSTHTDLGLDGAETLDVAVFKFRASDAEFEAGAGAAA